MLDAKSILESIVRGAAPSQSAQQTGGSLGDIFNDILKDSGANRGGTQGSGGSIGDILGEIGRSLSQPQGQAPTGSPPSGGGDAGKGLGDIFGELARRIGQPSQTSSPVPSPRQAAPGTSADQGANPELGDIFAQLKDKLGQAGGSVTDGGSIAEVLGKIFTQATQGVKEGATRWRGDGRPRCVEPRDRKCRCRRAPG